MPTTHSLGDLGRALARRDAPRLRPRVLPRHRPARPPPPSAAPRRPRRCSRGARSVTDLDALAATARPDSASRRVGRRGSALTSRRVRQQDCSAGGDVARPAPSRSPLGRTFAPLASTCSRAGRSSRSCGACSRSSALVVLDVVGLALGIYLALVLRQVVAGTATSSGACSGARGRLSGSSSSRRSPILVFAQAGLYRAARAPARRRDASSPASSSSRSSCSRSGIGTGYDFRPRASSRRRSSSRRVTIGLLRAAYESASLEVMRAAGIRRRVVLVGEGESLARLKRSLAAARGGLDVRVRRSRRAATPFPGFGCSARGRSSRACSSRCGPTR